MRSNFSLNLKFKCVGGGGASKPAGCVCSTILYRSPKTTILYYYCIWRCLFFRVFFCTILNAAAFLPRDHGLDYVQFNQSIKNCGKADRSIYLLYKVDSAILSISWAQVLFVYRIWYYYSITDRTTVRLCIYVVRMVLEALLGYYLYVPTGPLE